ncbi:MAG: DUF393 domain-containing protein [Deltaproteobacteria bacterium]|jgi:predicted DCC family thiol-disulfide oxidoreductase YuxK|nr:DUF393 domain-containing protein [Deltaproteobacteria bacterium]
MNHVPIEKNIESTKIIFFDGYCQLCNKAIDWLLRRDAKNQFFFASLQGQTAQKFLTGIYKSDFIEKDTLIYLRNQVPLEKSTAILMILIDIGGLWKAMGILFIIPRPLRDLIYFFIAKNRYRFFKKRTHCRLPSPDESKKLLP